MKKDLRKSGDKNYIKMGQESAEKELPGSFIPSISVRLSALFLNVMAKVSPKMTFERSGTTIMKCWNFLSAIVQSILK